MLARFQELDEVKEQLGPQAGLLMKVALIGLAVNVVGLFVFGHGGGGHGHSHGGGGSGHGHSHGGGGGGGHGHSHGGDDGGKWLALLLLWHAGLADNVACSLHSEHGHGHGASSDGATSTTSTTSDKSKKKHKKPKRNMNVHGVLLHVLGDALGSVGVVVAGLIIEYVARREQITVCVAHIPHVAIVLSPPGTRSLCWVTLASLPTLSSLSSSLPSFSWAQFPL